MRHNPAAGAVVIMLRSLKMHGMAQAVGELTEQGSRIRARLNFSSQRVLAPSPARPEASAGNVRPPSPIFWPAERFQRYGGGQSPVRRSRSLQVSRRHPVDTARDRAFPAHARAALS